MSPIVTTVCVLLISLPVATAALPKTNLIAFVSHWHESTVAVDKTTCELDPQWVGTVKRAYLRGGERVYRDDQPLHIRFTHLFVSKPLGSFNESPPANPVIHVTRARTRPDDTLGPVSGGETPAFTKGLPTVEAVSQAQNLNDLEKWFGRSRSPTGAWGNGRSLHWTAGWTWFTIEATNRLRYMSVFTHISTANPGAIAKIDSLEIREGSFRPADPNSAEDRVKFKTGEEVFVEEQRSKTEARARFPQPLRSLLEARETPDDSDLNAYKNALNAIRANPDPQLFPQLVVAMADDTVRFKGFLEDILFDRFLKLEPWREPQRTRALKALADAIPEVKSPHVLQDVVGLLLYAHGGGKFVFPGTAVHIEVKPPPSLYSLSFNSAPPADDLRSVAMESHREIKRRYPQLWAERP